MKKCKFTDKEGLQQEVSISLEHYKVAQKENISLRQLINREYPTVVDAKHDTFTQLCQSIGMYTKPAKELGLRPITMAEVEYGGLDFSAAMSGSEVSPVQSRILFPAVIAELVENKLQVDRSSAMQALDAMLADVYSVAGRRIEQPYLDYTRKGGPEEARNMARAQGAEPATMLTIKAGEKTLTIPETPLAVTVTDEALASTTIDMVALAMARQAEVEGYARVGEDLKKVLSGDTDAGSYGTAALTTVNADVYDSTIAADGALTDLAFAKWLYTGLGTRVINYIVTDFAGAYAIQNRTNKPEVTDATLTGESFNTANSIFFPNMINNVQIFIVPTAAAWPANTLMGFDSKYAMRKWVNTLATYSDVERYVTRRASTFVVSFGSKITRYFDDAFAVLKLVNT